MEHRVSVSAKQAFLDFEARADAAMEKLAIARLPARAIWSALHTTVFHALHVNEPGNPETRQTGETTSYRISYLIPWLRARPAGPLGAGTADVLGAFRDADPDGRELINMIGYAHLCEVMPDVRRDKFKVEQVGEGFRLTLPSAEAEEAEATDIIVSELALNFIASRGPRLPEDEIFPLARTSPTLDEALLWRVYKRQRATYQRDVREEPLVGDRPLMRIFGFNRYGFQELRSSIFAIADVFSQLAIVLWFSSMNEKGDPSDETFEWVSICWEYEPFLQKLAELTGQTRNRLESFIDHFTLDYRLPPREARGGEGFTPPFVRFDKSILFSPDLIFRYCQPRNALFHLIRADPALFDELISHELEPTLISAIVAEFDRVDGLIVRSNVNYPGGELDLVIADASGQHVVVCEIKAPLPPQGSRSTERLAGRMREGLQQLERFRHLDNPLEILSRALGIDVSGAKVDYMITGRSCFGAPEVWRQGATVTPATLPLIRLAVDSMKQQGAVSAAKLCDTIRHIVAEIMRDAQPSWQLGELQLFDTKLETPQLIYDRTSVSRWMQRAARG